MRYCANGFTPDNIETITVVDTAPVIGNIAFYGVLSSGADFSVDDTLYGIVSAMPDKTSLNDNQAASLLYASSVVYMAQNDTIDTQTDNKIRSAILTALKVILPPFFFAIDKSRVGIDCPPYVSLTQILDDTDFLYDVSDIKSGCTDIVTIDKKTCFLLLPVADEIENINAMIEVCNDNLRIAELSLDFSDICSSLDAVKEAYAYLFRAEEVAKKLPPIVKISAEYCPDSGLTFLMEKTYSAFGELMTAEVVSFYCGEPDDDSTKFYAQNRSLKAEMG